MISFPDCLLLITLFHSFIGFLLAYLLPCNLLIEPLHLPLAVCSIAIYSTTLPISLNGF